MAKKLVEKLNGVIEVKLDGKTWPLVVTNRIIMEIEDKTGMNLISGANGNLSNPTVRVTSTVMHELLLRAGAKYTFDQVVDFIHLGNMGACIQAIHAAWHLSSVPPKPESPSDPTIAAAE